MPLLQKHVDNLADRWFKISGEVLTKEEAWDMATRLLTFFDTLQQISPAFKGDNSILTTENLNVIDEGETPVKN